MNKKIFFVIFSIIALFVDVGFAGKYSPMAYFLIFPLVFFVLQFYFNSEDLIISGLVYGFIFDVVSLGNFPIMTVMIILIMIFAGFLRGRVIDGSHPFNTMVFTLIIGLVFYFLSGFMSGGILFEAGFFISLFYNLLISGSIYLILKYLIERFLKRELR